MASKGIWRPLRSRRGFQNINKVALFKSSSSSCPICSFAGNRPLSLASRERREPSQRPFRRYQSTAPTAQNPREELENILKELWRQAPHISRSFRLQLAIDTLRQTPGEERVRIALMGLGDDGTKNDVAKSVLRLLLADPLQDKQQWETDIEQRHENEPFLVQIGPAPGGPESIHFATTMSSELHVSSPVYNSANLEILYVPITPENLLQNNEHVILEPVLDDSTEPATTFPVHKTLLVADGFKGALQITGFPSNDRVLPTTNLTGIPNRQLDSPLVIVDTELAEKGLAIFRQGPQNALQYETLWSSSNIPHLAQWLRQGVQPTNDGTTKPIVRDSLVSWLHEVRMNLELSEVPLVQDENPSTVGRIFLSELSDWSAAAHSELQKELELAFSSRRWRKLRWWKLFWRVDDVALLASELLAQRFLPTAERELIYVTGRIAEGVYRPVAYSQPASSSIQASTAANALPQAPKWPTHISFTRRFLLQETIPALQALAQRLVAQSLGTTGIASSLAALLYASSAVSTLYEAAAVAALGVILSLGRMQRKWESAREFWEGEVSEEGRKAVKGAEESVLDVLIPKTSEEPPVDASLKKVRELLDKAEDALGRMR